MVQQDMGQKYKRQYFIKHQYITVTTFTKADAIVATVSQLAKVIWDKVPSNIGETEKEQLTTLVIIFNTVAKKITTTEADKHGMASNHYTIQMRVGLTPPEQATKPTLTIDT